ncbi:MAG: hypothetical protein ABIR25_06295 [Sphingomicrobium sp.]
MKLPTPIHGWRVLAGEMGVIAVSVLIALGAQQLVERREWNQKAAATEEAIKDELAVSAGFSYERRIIQPCLQGKIRELADKLVANEGAWSASPMKLSSAQYRNVMPPAYRAPSRTFLSDAWTTAMSDGTVNHLPAARVQQFSALYNQVGDMARLQEEEQSAGASLTPLSFDGRLDDRTRAEMIARLAEVDRINSLMALIGGQIIDALRELKFGYDKSEVTMGAKGVVTEQRGIRGTCVAPTALDLG